MATSKAPVVVGKIISAHGVKGWVKIYSHTRPRWQVLQYKNWLLGDGDANRWREMAVVSSEPKMNPKGENNLSSDKLLVKLEGVDDREAAEKLCKQHIAVLESQLDKLPSGEYYWRDLIGLRVMNRDAVELGCVAELLETGANDILVVRDEKNNERLLPWNDSVVVGVDLTQRHIKVDWELDF